MGGQPKIALMSETTGHLFATGVYTETFLGGADGLGSEHHLDNGSSTLEITGEEELAWGLDGGRGRLICKQH